MNPKNRWIKMADAIPWEIFEKKYSLSFLIIQTRYQYSDRVLVEQLTENPYYQYFIVLPGYQEEPPIDAGTLVFFRKRFDQQTLNMKIMISLII